MFSGIVECQTPVLSMTSRQGVDELQVRRPSKFNDLKIGDSISVDGVCLTLENNNEEKMIFALAAETLQVTQWRPQEMVGRFVNVERSLGFGERVHGHLVTGHVDGRASILEIDHIGEMAQVKIEYPRDLAPFLWKKGSVAINGVSLTINEKHSRGFIKVCLIPETARRTNLGNLHVGDGVNMEVDHFARAVVEGMRERQPESAEANEEIG